MIIIFHNSAFALLWINFGSIKDKMKYFLRYIEVLFLIIFYGKGDSREVATLLNHECVSTHGMFPFQEILPMFQRLPPICPCRMPVKKG